MLDFDWPPTWYQPPTYKDHEAYIYDTAILRSNRLIGQEAKSVLYGGNMFVLFNFKDDKCAYYMILLILRNVPWNPVRRGAPVSSCVAQIKWVSRERKRGGASLIVAAADMTLICKEMKQDFRYRGPSVACSLVALPQLDWQHERLLTMMWLPLKALRERRRIEVDVFGDDNFPNKHIKIKDCTGVFEQTIGMYKPEHLEMGSLSESSSDSDPIEDESDGSDSERSKDGDQDSCAEEEDGEDDSEDEGRTSNGSDDVAYEESEDDDASTSGESGEDDSDEAASIKSHELCSNVSA